MSAPEKLLVSDRDTGGIVILQDGGFDGKVMDRYRADGMEASPFEFSSMDIDRHFIHRGRLREREPMLARINQTRVKTDGNDKITIYGAPLGALVTVRHGRTVMQDRNDGVINLRASLPGRWSVEIEHPAYLTQTFDIIAE